MRTKKTLEESGWPVCSAPLSYTQSSKILFGMIVFKRKCFPKMPDMFDREDASILRSQKHITIGSFTIWHGFKCVLRGKTPQRDLDDLAISPSRRQRAPKCQNRLIMPDKGES